MISDAASAPIQAAPEAVRVAVRARRHLHRFPELSFAEHETSKYLQARLDELGLAYRTGFAGTGIVARIETGRPGPVTAFRADMDALPISEQTGLPFSSEHPGVMHACGHDLHSGVLLGLAAQLTAIRSQLVGTIVFVFQPGEEANGGASRVITDGALDQPSVERIFALHAAPGIPTGSIATRAGAVTATDDEFSIRVRGAAAHSSEPQLGVNAVTAASALATAITQIPSHLDPFSVATVTLASIHGGEAINVIPDECVITGMVRCVSEDDKQQIRDELERLVSHICAAYGAEAKLTITEGFPPVVNDESCTAIVRDAARRLLDDDTSFIEMPRPHMGSEDFAYYGKHVPGALFLLGCTGPESGESGLHTGELNLDESAIPVGIAMFTAIALLTNGAPSSSAHLHLGDGQR